MTTVQLVPVMLGLLLLAAHFLRAGNMVLVVVSLLLLVLLGVRRRWAARVLQLALLLGAAEWIRTLVELAGYRSRAGQPMLRLILILGSVALLTALAALVFRTVRVRRWFRLESDAAST